MGENGTSLMGEIFISVLPLDMFVQIANVNWDAWKGLYSTCRYLQKKIPENINAVVRYGEAKISQKNIDTVNYMIDKKTYFKIKYERVIANYEVDSDAKKQYRILLTYTHWRNKYVLEVYNNYWSLYDGSKTQITVREKGRDNQIGYNYLEQINIYDDESDFCARCIELFDKYSPVVYGNRFALLKNIFDELYDPEEIS
jgi:hypothetical protein